MINVKKVKEQSAFCKLLMTRLDDMLQSFEPSSFCGVDKHTARQDDIIRLRRELLALRKMLDPWAKEK